MTIDEVIKEFESRDTIKEMRCAIRLPIDSLHEKSKQEVVNKLSSFIVERFATEGYIPSDVTKLACKEFDYGLQERFSAYANARKDPEASAIGVIGKFYEQLYWSYENENERIRTLLKKIGRCKSLTKAKKLASKGGL